MEDQDGRTSNGTTLQGVLIAAVIVIGLVPAVQAEDSFVEAITSGKPIVNVRFRYEMVDQDGMAEDAAASTIRARFGYRTATFHVLFAHADIEVIKSLGSDSYNSSNNGQVLFPVVADPEDEDLSQIFVAYEGLKGTTFTLGRQRIVLGNAHFVGNVGWRQNERTYDASAVVSKLPREIILIYAHINNVTRIFGENHSNPATVSLYTNNVPVRPKGR